MLLSVIVLLCVLLAPLVSDGSRAGGRRHKPGCLGFLPKLLGLWVGSTLVAMPVGLLIAQDRATLGHRWAPWLAIAAAPLMAWGLARLLSPVQVRGRTVLIRAAVLLVVVVTAERLALFGGVPVRSTAGPASVIAFVMTVTCIGSWRLTDRFHRPAHLLASATAMGASAVAVGWWVLAYEGTLFPDPRSAAGIVQLTALLLLAVSAVASYGLCVGLWRLFRWLRYGPPPEPAPTGVPGWPPLRGEVWNAFITHEDGGGKDRPVLVWEAGDTHADVLKITSTDKSHLPRLYLSLPWYDWHEVLAHDSWLELKSTSIPYARFRSLRGNCLDETWDEVVARKRKPTRSPARPDPRQTTPRSRSPRHGSRPARAAPRIGRSRKDS